MKRALYIVSGLLYGTALGYFFLFFLLHLTSLYMTSDDDLNQAVRIGLLMWLVLIFLAGSLGNGLYIKNMNQSELPKSKWFIVIFLGIITGLVIGDLVQGLATTVIDWRISTTGREENLLALLVWFIFALIGGLVANRLTKSLIINKEK